MQILRDTLRVLIGLGKWFRLFLIVGVFAVPALLGYLYWERSHGITIGTTVYLEQGLPAEEFRDAVDHETVHQWRNLGLIERDLAELYVALRRWERGAILPTAAKTFDAGLRSSLEADRALSDIHAYISDGAEPKQTEKSPTAYFVLGLIAGLCEQDRLPTGSFIVLLMKGSTVEYAYEHSRYIEQALILVRDKVPEVEHTTVQHLAAWTWAHLLLARVGLQSDKTRSDFNIGRELRKGDDTEEMQNRLMRALDSSYLTGSVIGTAAVLAGFLLEGFERDYPQALAVPEEVLFRSGKLEDIQAAVGGKPTDWQRHERLLLETTTGQIWPK